MTQFFQNWYKNVHPHRSLTSKKNSWGFNCRKLLHDWDIVLNSCCRSSLNLLQLRRKWISSSTSPESHCPHNLWCVGIPWYLPVSLCRQCAEILSFVKHLLCSKLPITSIWKFRILPWLPPWMRPNLGWLSQVVVVGSTGWSFVERMNIYIHLCLSLLSEISKHGCDELMLFLS